MSARVHGEVGTLKIVRALSLCLAFGAVIAVAIGCSGRDRAPAWTEVLGGSGGEGGEQGGSSGSSGQQSEGGDGPATIAFDESKVYLWGNLGLGQQAYRSAIALVTEPNVYSVGVSIFVDSSTGQISGDRLLYRSSVPRAVRVFVPDLTVSAPADSIEYPEDGEQNDIAVDTPACAEGDDGPRSFLVGPNESVIYSCPDGAWYDSDGEVVDTGGYLPVSISDDGLLAVAGVSATQTIVWKGVFEPSTGVAHVTTNLGTRLLAAARSRGSGFRIVLMGSRAGDLPELWEIDSDGTETLAGTFPEPPDGPDPEGYQVNDQNSRLDGDGAWYEQAGGTVIRRTVDGDSEVVYPPTYSPIVQMEFASSLFSGR